MACFSGSFSRALDSKGRVVLPACWREGFSEAYIPDPGAPGTVFWITAFYGRLVGYPPSEWMQIVEGLSRIRFPSKRLSHFKSKVLGLAQSVELDAQGRLRLPQTLVSAGGLIREVMLVGMLSKFEIWDRARFDALEIEDVSEELGQQDIEIAL